MAHSPKKPGSHDRSAAVPYKDAVIFGVIAAWIVLIVTLIVTQAWRSFTLLGYSLLYSVIAFAVCTGGAVLMNKVVSGQQHKDSVDGPVLK